MHFYSQSSLNCLFVEQSWMRNTRMQIPLIHATIWFVHASMGTWHAPRVFTQQMPPVSGASEPTCTCNFSECCCSFLLLVYYSSLSPLHRWGPLLSGFFLFSEFLLPLSPVTINNTESSYLELTPIQLKKMLPVNVLGTELRHILFKVEAH